MTKWINNTKYNSYIVNFNKEGVIDRLISPTMNVTLSKGIYTYKGHIKMNECWFDLVVDKPQKNKKYICTCPKAGDQKIIIANNRIILILAGVIISDEEFIDHSKRNIYSTEPIIKKLFNIIIKSHSHSKSYRFQI